MKQSNYKNPPVAKIESTILEKFGVERRDDYFWLKDKSNPDVMNYILDENNYTEEVMEDTKGLQESIYKELVGRIKEDDESYPYLDGEYYYFTRTEKGEDYSTILRKKELNSSSEEVVFDLNSMASNSKAFIFYGYKISPDGKFAAYLHNFTGSYAEFTLKIKNLESGEDLSFSMDGVASIEWANDSKTLVYSKIDETLRSTYVYVQNIFESRVNLIYEEKDKKFSVYVSKDKQVKYIYLSSESSTTTEEMYLSADNPLSSPMVFLPRKHKTEYSIEYHINSFIVQYKDENNINSKIYIAPIKTHQDMSTWTELISHDENVYIENFLVLKDFLITLTRENGLKQINIVSFASNDVKSINFPELAYDTGFSVNIQFDTTKFRYSYSSLKRPATLYEYDIVTCETNVLKVQEVPSGFNPNDYELERVMVVANDGAKVPMPILYKKGVKKDGANPALIYAYGSYGYSTNPSFNPNVFSLVDRGYVFAMAEIRGGSQMGEHWYQDGKLLNKKNTFTDFISCSEFLIENNYTTNSKLAILGGSAGGLLMGAVANMRPDLYNCVLAMVPFVDVVTTMLDDSLPLTTGEYEEWGNPNEREYFDYMLSYSPYDNIEEKDYPNMLITGGINDSQVLYHEPTKYAAKLRKLKTDDNVLLLKIDMESGHGGATGRYGRFKDVAFEYAFILNFTK